MPVCAPMMRVQIGKAVRCPNPVMLYTRMHKGIGIIEDKTCQTDQMPDILIINTAIIVKMMKKSASRIICMWFVKGQNIGDMLAQETGIFKIWIISLLLMFPIAAR